ncbi:MAG: hypothetical protein GX557_13990 [Chloroflexi bacterium]|nr:hypothetical protein [Chloroflexota bacterium]
MKRMGVLRLMCLCLALVLFLAVPASAGVGVIQFKGHLTALSMSDPATWTYTPLPGGRLLITDAVLFSCKQADEVDPAYDYYSGCYRCECSEIVEPSGAVRTWGTCTTLGLDNAPGGGWVGEFQGEWAAPLDEGGVANNISLHMKSVGTGTLTGWTMDLREWAKDPLTSGDFGHMTPPR